MNLLRLTIITSLSVTLLIACGKSEDNHIRFGMSKMASNFDTRHMTDAASYRIGRLIYQRLVDFDENMTVIPALASWKMITPTRYEFTLTTKRFFHNGSPVESYDVKATYDDVLNKKNGSPHRGTLSIIEQINTPDAERIIFNLKRADPLFPAYLIIGILPRQLIKQKHRFEIHPVGSGPFKFVSWPEEGRLLIERLRDNQIFEFIEVPKPLTRALKLTRGEIHMMQNNVPSELVAWLQKQNSLQIERRRGSNYSYLGFNMEDPALAQLEVRQAIAHAINRKQVIQYIFNNHAREASALLPPDHWAGNPALTTVAYEPDTARALLRQAGYTAQNPLELTFKTSSDPFRVRLATVMQDQLKQVGIKVEIRSYDWGTFYGDIKSGRFQLYSLAWVGIKTPDIFRYVFHSSAVPPDGANRGRYNNPHVDKLIETVEKKTNQNEQAELYRQLQALLLNDLPYIPLWYEDHVFMSNKQVRGYTISADGNFDGLLHAELSAP